MIAVFAAERIVLTMAMVYERSPDGWRPVKATTTMFDSTGRATLVSDQNLRGVSFNRRTASLGLLQRLQNSATTLGEALGRFALPDVLHAMTPASADMTLSDSGCLDEFLNLVAAGAVAAGAYIALDIALAACIGLPLSCPAVVAAYAFLTGALLAVAAAQIAYWECLNQPAGPISRPGTGSGGGGGGPCIEIVWEISYDGGSTWQYYDTTWVCPATVLEG